MAFFALLAGSTEQYSRHTPGGDCKRVRAEANKPEHMQMPVCRRFQEYAPAHWLCYDEPVTGLEIRDALSHRVVSALQGAGICEVPAFRMC